MSWAEMSLMTASRSECDTDMNVKVLESQKQLRPATYPTIWRRVPFRI